MPPKNNRKQTFWPSPKDTNRGKNCPLSLSIFPFGLFYFSSIILQPSKETNENVSTLKKKPFGHSVKALLWFCFIQVPPYLDWHSIQWNRLENNVIAHHLWRLWLVFNNVWWLDLSSQEQVNHFVNQLKSPLVTQIWVVLSFLFCYSRGLSRKLYSFFSFGTNPITTLTHITVILCECVCAWPTLIFWLNLTFWNLFFRENWTLRFQLRRVDGVSVGITNAHDNVEMDEWAECEPFSTNWSTFFILLLSRTNKDVVVDSIQLTFEFLDCFFLSCLVAGWVVTSDLSRQQVVHQYEKKKSPKKKKTKQTKTSTHTQKWEMALG